MSGADVKMLTASDDVKFVPKTTRQYALDLIAKHRELCGRMHPAALLVADEGLLDGLTQLIEDLAVQRVMAVMGSVVEQIETEVVPVLRDLRDRTEQKREFAEWTRALIENHTVGEPRAPAMNPEIPF